MSRLWWAGIAACATITSTACGTTAPSPTSTATPSPTVDVATRPSTPVHISIVEPTDGATIHGTSVHVVVGIDGGTVDKTTSTRVTPTTGHVHVYLDNQALYMSYTLTEDIPVQPNLTYSLHAEYVASDHVPFNPRDITPTIIFHVAPS